MSEAIGRQWNGNLSDIRSADEANALLQILILLTRFRTLVREIMEEESSKS